MPPEQHMRASDVKSPEASADVPDAAADQTAFKPTPRFWAILVVLAIISLLTSLEATVTSTVMPSLVADLGGGDDYIWVSNAYFLTMTALMPVFGQLADIFGRRWPLIISAILFMIGCGICGGATTMAAMIAGRAVQGVGGAGIGVLCEMVVCDLVPLRQRGTYMGAVFGMVGLGAAIGPLIGGLLTTYSTWRWAFYMGLPIGGVGMVLLAAVLHVRSDRSQTLAAKLARLDWAGNAVFVGGTMAVLLALSRAGGARAWTSYAVLVPLLVGVAALGVFAVLEGRTRWTANPVMPPRLFGHAVGAVVMLLTWLHGIVTMWVLYFLPVYLQGVLGLTAYAAGLALLPTVLALLPGAIVGGLLLSTLGRYKPVLMLCFALVVVGFGLLSLLDESASTARCVAFQIVESFGAGLAMAALLPALLAPLTDADTALATATWAFTRSFGVLWGVAIGATVYGDHAAHLARTGAIADPSVAAVFDAGGAYAVATARYLDALSPDTRAQVVAVQRLALQRSWQVAIAFGAVGFVAAAILKQVPLRQVNDTEFGLVQPAHKTADAEAEPAQGRAASADVS